MRFLMAAAGVLVSILPLVFFWVGAQTFVRPLERGMAVVMAIGTTGLLVLSIALLFTPSVQRLQAILLVAIVAVVSVILSTHRLFR